MAEDSKIRIDHNAFRFCPSHFPAKCIEHSPAYVTWLVGLHASSVPAPPSLPIPTVSFLETFATTPETSRHLLRWQLQLFLEMDCVN